MLRKIIYASAAAAVFAATSLSPASAAGPSLGLAAKLDTGSLVEQASFWGEPYPYGYRYRHGCLRRVWEHTPWGRELHLVWVCRPVH